MSSVPVMLPLDAVWSLRVAFPVLRTLYVHLKSPLSIVLVPLMVPSMGPANDELVGCGVGDVGVVGDDVVPVPVVPLGDEEVAAGELLPPPAAFAATKAPPATAPPMMPSVVPDRPPPTPPPAPAAPDPPPDPEPLPAPLAALAASAAVSTFDCAMVATAVCPWNVAVA
jgi:hypothetical protein